MAKPRKRSAKELRATAYHEAGHAVITVALGLTINKVSIVPGEGYSGVCREPGVLGYESSSRRDRRSIARAAIVGSYAGMHAQRLVDPGAPDFHGEGDEADAFELSRMFEVFPRKIGWVGDEQHLAFLDRLRVEARRLVRKHRHAIDKLAELLLQRQELERAEAVQLIESVLDAEDRCP